MPIMSTEAGKEYFGFLCKNPKCGLPIIAGEIPREYLDADGVPQIASSRPEHKIVCEQCGFEAVYQTKELQRFRVSEKGGLH